MHPMDIMLALQHAVEREGADPHEALQAFELLCTRLEQCRLRYLQTKSQNVIQLGNIQQALETCKTCKDGLMGYSMSSLNALR